MDRLAVLTCAEYRCIESAVKKGRCFVEAFGGGIEYHVHTPVTKSGLIASLNGADHAVMGFHGVPNAIYNLGEDGSSNLIINASDVSTLPKMPRLRLVIMLVCSAAGGDTESNLAAELSKRIADDGLVIANRYVITGTSSYYRSKNNKPGWVAYQNGKVVIPETDFPTRSTMRDFYYTVKKYRDGII